MPGDFGSILSTDEKVQPGQGGICRLPVLGTSTEDGLDTHSIWRATRLGSRYVRVTVRVRFHQTAPSLCPAMRSRVEDLRL